MKKAVAFLFLFVFIIVSIPAQEVEIFAKTVPIVKIYSHSLGYKVYYMKSTMKLGSFCIPISWFSAGGKAEMIWGKDSTYPYFSIFWRDGKFSFIRVFVRENISGLTWGNLRTGENTSKDFDVEELNIEF